MRLYLCRPHFRCCPVAHLPGHPSPTCQWLAPRRRRFEQRSRSLCAPEYSLHVTISLTSSAPRSLLMSHKNRRMSGKEIPPCGLTKYSQVSLSIKPTAANRVSAQLSLVNDDECASINDFSDEGENEMWASYLCTIPTIS